MRDKSLVKVSYRHCGDTRTEGNGVPISCDTNGNGTEVGKPLHLQRMPLHSCIGMWVSGHCKRVQKLQYCSEIPIVQRHTPRGVGKCGPTRCHRPHGTTVSREGFTARLRAAYTGDGQPDNGVASNFLFDRDFSAGTVLFDQFKGGVEAASYQQLIDPDVSGQPPDGADALVTEGAFQSAVFVQPAIALSPIPWNQIRLGASLFWSTAPMSQPFYTYRAGGAPRNHLNTSFEGNYLGTELNWSVLFLNMGGASTRSASLDLQFGHLFTGEPIQAGGRPSQIHHAMAIVKTEW